LEGGSTRGLGYIRVARAGSWRFAVERRDTGSWARESSMRSAQAEASMAGRWGQKERWSSGRFHVRRQSALLGFATELHLKSFKQG
jgi:hypothetical protein